MLFGKLNLISYLADESKTIDDYEKIINYNLCALDFDCLRA